MRPFTSKKHLNGAVGAAVGAVSLLTVCGAPSGAMAAAITVGDPSFENIPTSGVNCFGPSCITGAWVGGNDTGITDTSLGAHALPTPLPDGVKAVFSNQAQISQVLVGEAIQADTRYTLEVDVGFWAGHPFAPNPTIELWNATTSILLGSTAANQSLSGWVTIALIVDIGATHAALGQDLQIILKHGGGACKPACFDQIYFDHVRLDASPLNAAAEIPLPGAIWLFAFGLAGFGAAMRKR